MTDKKKYKELSTNKTVISANSSDQITVKKYNLCYFLFKNFL